MVKKILIQYDHSVNTRILRKQHLHVSITEFIDHLILIFSPLLENLMRLFCGE